MSADVCVLVKRGRDGVGGVALCSGIPLRNQLLGFTTLHQLITMTLCMCMHVRLCFWVFVGSTKRETLP